MSPVGNCWANFVHLFLPLGVVLTNGIMLGMMGTLGLLNLGLNAGPIACRVGMFMLCGGIGSGGRLSIYRPGLMLSCLPVSAIVIHTNWKLLMATPDMLPGKLFLSIIPGNLRFPDARMAMMAMLLPFGGWTALSMLNSPLGLRLLMRLIRAPTLVLVVLLLMHCRMLFYDVNGVRLERLAYFPLRKLSVV